MNRLNILIRLANISVILVTLLAYLAPFVNPVRIWFFSILGLGYPFLLMANILFIIFWAFRKNRYAFYSLACILVGFNYFTNFFGLSFFAGPQKSKNELVVMTYNTAGFKGFNGDKKEARDKKMASFDKMLEKYGRPDVFCTQETRDAPILKAIGETAGFDHSYRKKGTVIFSKFPFLQQGEIPFENSSNSCIWADLQAPGGTVRVYNVHLQSNRMSSTADKIVTKGNIRDKQTWKDTRFVLTRFKDGAQIRAKQAQAVKKHISASPHPVIVCGDFNDTPVSYTYDVLSKNLCDSFREKGGGLGTTFAGKLPALRIDYVLANPSFHILDHLVPKLELSDHYPVFVRLKL